MTKLRLPIAMDKLCCAYPQKLKLKNVDNGKFYRSNNISTNNMNDVAKKGIKKIINLKSLTEEELKKLQTSAIANGIEFHNIPINLFNIKELKEQAKKLIELYKTNNKPMLVHCTFGKDRTGFATALYQKNIQNKTLSSVIKEMYENGFRKIFFTLEECLHQI